MHNALQCAAAEEEGTSDLATTSLTAQVPGTFLDQQSILCHENSSLVFTILLKCLAA